MRDVRHRLRSHNLPEPGPVTIRQISWQADIDGAVNVLIAAHSKAGSMSDRFHPNVLRARMRAFLEPGRRDAPMFFAAFGGGRGRVVGVVAVSPSFCSALGWELGYLAVDPLWQGLGLAGVMIDEAVAFVLAQRPAPGFVLVRAANPAMFQAAGFQPVHGGGDTPSLMLLPL
ncbi:GNAT family N-acetyltransferase [Azospirillum sp. Sh1]|uniref:GNAT family N-acetyltransferase n=1 Tax=Azospirillum sp. Sh1 TaxID=2607285 RepID=UPI0011F009C0|nr:GNAT family N-acetyltransferase [Azospirillum sp. Sh1]KAA0571093.1 GNAT family N-acetyltransferase [Azospirillum sp. Sh1]